MYFGSEVEMCKCTLKGSPILNICCKRLQPCQLAILSLIKFILKTAYSNCIGTWLKQAEESPPMRQIPGNGLKLIDPLATVYPIFQLPPGEESLPRFS